MNLIQKIALPCFCDVRSGKIKKIKAIEAKDFVRFDLPYYTVPTPAAAYTMRAADIEIRDGAKVFEWICQTNLSQHDEAMASSEHTEYFNQSIGFDFSGINETYLSWLYELRGKDWVVFYENKNEKVRVVGTPEQPMKLTGSFTSNKSQRSSFGFVGQTVKPSPFVEVYDNAVLFANTSIISTALDYTYI